MYCFETLELTVMDEVRLHGVKHCMIRMMYVVRLVDRKSTDILLDRVGVVVKIKDMIIQSCCGGMVMSCAEISVPKCVRLWKLKKLGKGRRVD